MFNGINGKKLTGNKKTILIVEDDQETIGLLFQVLSRGGYIVLKAETGTEAIDIMSSNKPDLIILDLNLPDCNGLEILARLMAMHQSVQVIILTGHGSRDAVRSAMKAGAFDFITKPFDIDEVCAVVKEALMSKHPTVS
ncbi:MAG: response regulator [Pseudomonadota bacterium]